MQLFLLFIISALPSLKNESLCELLKQEIKYPNIFSGSIIDPQVLEKYRKFHEYVRLCTKKYKESSTDKSTDQ